MRESVIRNLRVFTAGTLGVPVVEFNTVAGSADSTNEIDIEAMNIFAPGGPGFVIRGGAGTYLRDFIVHGLRIEGANAPSPAISGDLLQIGDATLTGQVANIGFYGLELINPYTGYYAVETTAASATSMPYNVKFDGFIGTGPGSGIGVTYGRALVFNMFGIATTGTQVTVGPSNQVGQNIEIEGYGSEHAFTYNIDPTSTDLVLSPLRNYGNPSVPSIVPYVGGVIPNTPGSGGVDMQLTRTSPFHTASGPNATVSAEKATRPPTPIRSLRAAR